MHGHPVEGQLPVELAHVDGRVGRAVVAQRVQVDGVDDGTGHVVGVLTDSLQKGLQPPCSSAGRDKHTSLVTFHRQESLHSVPPKRIGQTDSSFPICSIVPSYLCRVRFQRERSNLFQTNSITIERNQDQAAEVK